MTLGPLGTQLGNVLESRDFLVPEIWMCGRKCCPKSMFAYIVAFHAEVFAEPSVLA